MFVYFFSCRKRHSYVVGALLEVITKEPRLERGKFEGGLELKLQHGGLDLQSNCALVVVVKVDRHKFTKTHGGAAQAIDLSLHFLVVLLRIVFPI